MRTFSQYLLEKTTSNRPYLSIGTGDDLDERDKTTVHDHSKNHDEIMKDVKHDKSLNDDEI